MACKRNQTREVQASDLKRAIADLMSEMALEEVPYGWIPLSEIVQETKMPVASVRRSLELKGIKSQKFRVMFNGRCVKILHYQILK